ncbi:hypothetical protein K1719_030957 [Acacia pycnantha]|nr:hypothetical protein K1719_030957 [Acacia pycnantha]
MHPSHLSERCNRSGIRLPLHIMCSEKEKQINKYRQSDLPIKRIKIDMRPERVTTFPKGAEMYSPWAKLWGVIVFPIEKFKTLISHAFPSQSITPVSSEVGGICSTSCQMLLRVLSRSVSSGGDRSGEVNGRNRNHLSSKSRATTRASFNPKKLQVHPERRRALFQLVCLSISHDCALFASHLTSGQKDGAEYRQNSDVHDILRRTRFSSVLDTDQPQTIPSHEFRNVLRHRKNGEFRSIEFLFSF